MIVNTLDSEFEIIYQRSHALLAAKVCWMWRGVRPGLDWIELINATAQHDHGWVESESKSLVKDGAPVNFLSVALEDALDLGQEAVDQAYVQSNKCGLLISRHVEHLYSGRREARQATKRWRARRFERMEQFGVSEDWVERHYELLLWGDTLSLLLCCRPSPFRDALRLSLEGHDFSLQSGGNQVWTLDPWPFTSDEYALQMEYYRVPRIEYRDGEDLLKQLAAGGPRVRMVTLSRP